MLKHLGIMLACALLFSTFIIAQKLPAAEVDSLGGKKAVPVKMPLSMTNSLIEKDGTLNVKALAQHIESVRAKLSQRVTSSGQAAGAKRSASQKRTAPKKPVVSTPADQRPHNACKNRGIGRRALAEMAEQLEDRADTDIDILEGTRNKRPPPTNRSAKDQSSRQPWGPTGTGDVDGCRAGNFFWTTPITIGGTTVQAIVDTGSSLTLIDGRMYDVKKAKYLNKNFTINFVDGSSASGHVGVRCTTLICLAHVLNITVGSKTGLSRRRQDCQCQFPRLNCLPR